LQLRGERYESARFRLDGGSACGGVLAAVAPGERAGEGMREMAGEALADSLEGMARGTMAVWLECCFRDGERESGGAGGQPPLALAPVMVALA